MHMENKNPQDPSLSLPKMRLDFLLYDLMLGKRIKETLKKREKREKRGKLWSRMTDGIIRLVTFLRLEP